MRHFILSVLLLMSVVSCDLVNFRSNSERLAKIGDNVLYKSDVYPLLPEGISPEDSISMVQQYIESWAMDYLMFRKAEEQLSKNEKDINQEVKDFKMSLLSFRFEKLYMENRIDTLVQDKEMLEYYNSHLQNFVYPNSIVKARVITISQNSPYYDNIKGSLGSEDGEDVDFLKDLCSSYAEKYEDFSMNWVDMASVAKALDMDLESCENIFAKSKSHIKNGNGKDVMAYIIDRVPPETPSPYEFNQLRIREAIISKRKQEILSNLERDLLKEGLEKKILKIYRSND